MNSQIFAIVIWLSLWLLVACVEEKKNIRTENISNKFSKNTNYKKEVSVEEEFKEVKKLANETIDFGREREFNKESTPTEEKWYTIVYTIINGITAVLTNIYDLIGRLTVFGGVIVAILAIALKLKNNRIKNCEIHPEQRKFIETTV